MSPGEGSPGTGACSDRTALFEYSAEYLLVEALPEDVLGGDGFGVEKVRKQATTVYPVW